MLKNVDKLLTGDLLKILCDMGHGDELVISDANFPAETCAQRLIRLPGIVILSRLLHFEKALFPISVTLCGIVIVFIELLPENGKLVISFTPSGISASVRSSLFRYKSPGMYSV